MAIIPTKRATNKAQHKYDAMDAVKGALMTVAASRLGGVLDDLVSHYSKELQKVRQVLHFLASLAAITLSIRLAVLHVPLASGATHGHERGSQHASTESYRQHCERPFFELRPPIQRAPHLIFQFVEILTQITSCLIGAAAFRPIGE